MLINTAIDDCNVANLRAVVLDELHMVDDDHRGYLMELIATKLLSLEHRVQIIGMSATLAVSADIELTVINWRATDRSRTLSSCLSGLTPICTRRSTDPCL